MEEMLVMPVNEDCFVKKKAGDVSLSGFISATWGSGASFYHHRHCI